ncbi:CheR family methyltransferase [Terracidiphilus sp.]|jgi:chemotaxis protein methyltransferase CheR|uniref:CheR family methyltransferase n=1 Tax=Terracidiphilus sp. TaxID=1964191 RepID=UPI003C1A3C9C
MQADFNYLRKMVNSLSHNVLDPSRDYLFETRLARLLRSREMSHIGELVEQLRGQRDAALERAVAEAMTINETSFFRDGRPFELLRTELLPSLIEKRMSTRKLRFWSAACSAGQEAYSLAMLLREHFPLLASWEIRIEGTDFSAEMVARASAGRYHRIEINRGLPARSVVRFFEHQGEEWAIKPELRRMCNFQQADLCQTPLPLAERFDVIFLRNVMLYFSNESRRKVLAEAHRLLAPDGVLFLGSSEQPADLSQWNPVLIGGTCHYTPKAQLTNRNIA